MCSYLMGAMDEVKMKNVFETTVLSLSGLKTSSETKKAIQNRSNIFIMSDAANPSYKGETKDHKSILSFMDKVAEDTRNVVAEDITALKSAHVNDADIVRLAELNSFMAYQIRLITGLRLMKGAEDERDIA